ncbi:MAG: hypothetical protein ACYC09_05205 [Bacteroidota bacterium]
MKTFVLFFSLFTAAFSQDDTLKNLERQILSSEDTDAELLAKSRRSVLSAIQNGDIAKAREVFQFTQVRFDPRRVTVWWDRERLLIFYWLGEFESALAEIRNPDTFGERRYSNTITPPDDLFFYDLKELTHAKKSVLRQSIRSGVLRSDEADFLYLFLDFITGKRTDSREDSERQQNQLNAAADEFLKDHGDSPYAAFVRNHIRYVIVTSPYGYGFSVGLGQSSPTGDATSLFGNAFALAMEFDAAYNAFAAYAHLSLGAGSKTNRAFTYDGNWIKGLPINITAGDLSVGYAVYDFNGFRIVPTVGIGGYDFTPPETERTKPGNDVSMSVFASVLTLHIDVPVTASESPLVGYQEQSYWMIRAGISHYFSHSSSSLQQGGLFLFTLSFGGFGRPLERDL